MILNLTLKKHTYFLFLAFPSVFSFFFSPRFVSSVFLNVGKIRETNGESEDGRDEEMGRMLCFCVDEKSRPWFGFTSHPNS